MAVTHQNIEDLKELIISKFEASEKNNKEDHKLITDKQDYTNGSVRKLQLWKAFLTGGWAVSSIIGSVILYQGIDYIKNNNDNISSMRQEIAEIQVSLTQE